MQTYRFASDLNGSVTDVKSLDTSGRRSGFQCISCGDAMVARLGAIRDRCFAHASLGTCSPETYLHVLGKYLFSKAFRECIRHGWPYWVGRRGEVCSDVYIGEYYVGRTPVSTVTERVNLCRFYDAVETERGVGGFVADLLLQDTGGKKKPIFVEMKVSHGLTEAKRRSGQQIIEITIASERDLSSIEDADVPADLAEWVMPVKPPKVSTVQSTIRELPALFGTEALSYFRTIGDGVGLQIYRNVVRHEYVALRDGFIIGTGSTAEMAATAAGFSTPPVAPLWVVPSQPSQPASPPRHEGTAETPSFLDEVLAVFGGRLLDD
jgi:hypothetical protein